MVANIAMDRSAVLLRRAAAVAFILSIPVLLLAGNVRYAANEVRLYQYSFDRYNVESRTRLARPELDRAADELVSYFNNDQHSINIVVTQAGRQVSLFNEREVRHLVDVKSLFRLVFRLQEIALGIVLSYIVGFFILVPGANLRRLATELVGSVGLTLAIVSGVGGFALLGFDDLFRRFHLLAFSNDFWQLNPRTDRLIQMFPQGFWFDATMLIGILTVLEAVALALSALIYLRLSSQVATLSPTVGQSLQAPK